MLEVKPKFNSWIKILSLEQEEELSKKTKGFTIIDCALFPKTPKKKKIDEEFNIEKTPRLLINQENAMKFFKYQLLNNKNIKHKNEKTKRNFQI